MSKRKEENKETVVSESVYTKGQLAESKRFAHQKDLINALLSDNIFYTIRDAEMIIEKYLKGKVN